MSNNELDKIEKLAAMTVHALGVLQRNLESKNFYEIARSPQALETAAAIARASYDETREKQGKKILPPPHPSTPYVN